MKLTRRDVVKAQAAVIRRAVQGILFGFAALVADRLLIRFRTSGRLWQFLEQVSDGLLIGIVRHIPLLGFLPEQLTFKPVQLVFECLNALVFLPNYCAQLAERIP